MLNFFLKNKKLFLSSSLISFLGIFILGAKPVSAADSIIESVVGSGVDTLVRGFLMGIGWIMLGVQWLVGVLMSIISNIVYALLKFADFAGAPIVKIGWGISLDIVNMFFILFLLIIAFSTVLRVESYGIKALLPKLLIAALLVNFSLVIAMPIIDFTQSLTGFFLEKSGGENFTGNIANALSISKIVPAPTNEQGESEGDCLKWDRNCWLSSPLNMMACFVNRTCIKTSDTVTAYPWGDGIKDVVNALMGLFMSIIFILIAAFVFAAFAGFLVVRILVIWFLLILAPFAWLLWILPATRSQWETWWKNLFKWSFFAPIYMLFVYIALRAYPAFLNESVRQNLNSQKDQASSIWPALMHPQSLLQFILICGFLLGGLVVAQKMSIYGAGYAITSAKWIGKSVASGTNRWVASGGRISPGIGKAIKKATRWGASKAKEGGTVARGLTKTADTMDKVGKVAGRVGDVKRGLVSLASPTTWKRESAESKRRAEHDAFDKGPGRDTIGALKRLQFGKILTGKDTRYADQEKAKEASRYASEFDKINDNDQLVDMYYESDQSSEKEGILRVLAKRNSMEDLFTGRQQSSPTDLRKHLRDTFGDKEGIRIGADVKALKIATGDIAYAGITGYDKKTGQTIMTEPGSKEEKELIIKEMDKRPAEKTMGALTLNSIFTLDKEGKPTAVHEQGAVIIQNMTQAHFSQADEMRDELLNTIHSPLGSGLIKATPDLDLAKVNGLIDGVEKQFKAKPEEKPEAKPEPLIKIYKK